MHEKRLHECVQNGEDVDVLRVGENMRPKIEGFFVGIFLLYSMLVS
jgi:hypothetical protein